MKEVETPYWGKAVVTTLLLIMIFSIWSTVMYFVFYEVLDCFMG